MAKSVSSTTKKTTSGTKKTSTIKASTSRKTKNVTLDEMIANISSGIGNEICFNDFKQYIAEVMTVNDISNKVFIFKLKPTTQEVLDKIQSIISSITPFLEKENSAIIAIPDVDEVNIEVNDLDAAIEYLQKIRDNIDKK